MSVTITRRLHEFTLGVFLSTGLLSAQPGWHTVKEPVRYRYHRIGRSCPILAMLIPQNT